MGHLVDLPINPSRNSFQIAYFYAMTPKKQLMCIAREQISTISVRAVQTNVPAQDIGCSTPDEGLICIKKDVLDQQIIDVNDQTVLLLITSFMPRYMP